MILVISIPYPDSVHIVYSEFVHKLSEGCNLCVRAVLCVRNGRSSTGMHIIRVGFVDTFQSSFRGFNRIRLFPRTVENVLFV